MKVYDLVRFSEESYFNGAVQTEWFYDQSRMQKIATSYVFHGPKYFGVAAGDLTKSSHKLIDTASFAWRVAEKLYSNQNNNNFLMTIAGYGTGKSHIAVCLGALFSGNKVLSRDIERNISLADTEIGLQISKINTRRNLVIVLNGMNNFNLDSEILRCARLSLEQNGEDDSILRSLTRSYDIARHFVEKNFSTYVSSFEKCAVMNGISLVGNALRSYLMEHIDNNAVLTIINKVYSEANGDTISWERGISAGDVLTLLSEKLCGDTKPFNKILVLFDEFGRYIEYAAANPAIAGEASLQQIFEAVQSASGKIVFTGFIQNDLSAYLSRIEKTSNIIRYVGRYENSEKFYLSSNFETILANLLKKDETKGFSRIVGNAISHYERFHTRLFESLYRWDRSSQKKGVWETQRLYNSVILQGCYPLHPITTWLLSNTSNWMQQRSTIAFAAEMYENIKDAEITGNWLPYVYPIDIVDSNIYNEMLNSEEKGLVQSQYCMLYRDIILKIGSKLTENESKVLKAILVLNIGKFALRDKEDAILALRYISNLKEEDITVALKTLEDSHGVIAFDDNSQTYDLIAEANGFNEFKRIFAKYRMGTVVSINDIDSDLLAQSPLAGSVETSFAQVHNISSTEWVFEKRLLASNQITNEYVQILKRNLDNNFSGEDPRGYLLYAYCNSHSETEVSRLSSIFLQEKLDSYAIIILFLDDSDNAVMDALMVKNTIAKFSKGDQERFQKHIAAQIRFQNSKVLKALNQLILQRTYVAGNGLATYEGRMNNLCSQKFDTLYPKAPSFAFDGFQNKVTTQAKKFLTNICIKLFDRTLMNIQSYQALTQDEKNRVKACLAVGMATSWQVFDSNCLLIEPMNSTINDIFSSLKRKVTEEEPQSVSSLFGEYMRPPYGMNSNAIALLLFYFIAEQENALYCYYGQEKLKAFHLSDKIFKAGKLQENELWRIKLQINTNAEIDPVVDVCKSALACKKVEDCGPLKVKLNQILEQEGNPVTNQTLVAQAIMRLDVGISLLQQINEKNRKVKEILVEAKKQFIIHKFYKVFENLVDYSKPVSAEYDLSLGDGLTAQAQSLRNEVDGVIKEKYTAALCKVKCEITQLSQIKALYKKISECLTENGYGTYAELTDKRIIALESELIAKQRYEAAIAEVQKDLAIHSDFSSNSYKELNDIKVKMTKWASYFEAATDLPATIKSPIMETISQLVIRISTKQESMLVSVRDSLNESSNVSNLQELLGLIKTLEQYKEYQFEKDTFDEIEGCLIVLKEQIKTIETLPKTLDELYLTRNAEHEYTFAVNNEREAIIRRLEAAQSEWESKALLQVENEVSEFSASDCASWLEQTVPAFITSKCREHYESVRELVSQRLHTCKIDGVVTMFSKLNSAEKRQCLEILNRNI